MPELDPTTLTTLQGELVTWRFIGDRSWGFGQVRTAAETVPIVGTLLGARTGDHVQLTGAWGEHPKFGRQFKFRSITAALPATDAGVIAWLVATLPGIGAKRATELVTRYGADLWFVLETNPERIATEVDGITPAGALRIAQAYAAHRDDRDAMVALRGWGLTDSQIKHCLAAWRTLTTSVDEIRANPYQLCHHVWGFGFTRADEVALRVGVPSDAPERIAAAVEHVLDIAQQAGHCWVFAKQLQAEVVRLVGCDKRQAVRGVWDSVAAKRVVEHHMRFYPARLARAEERCAAQLTGFFT